MEILPDSKCKWMRSRWLRIVRIPAAFALVFGIIACCTLQPGVSTNEPAILVADPARLRQQVRALTENFGPRYHFERESMVKVREFIGAMFKAAGAQVEEQEYTIIGRGGSQYNVRAFFGDRSKPRIVVGAHYDSCQAHATAVNPGADDNASGVAGLLELARLLAKQPPGDVCVELVAYSTEEPPFFGTEDMGSHRHAESLRQENVEVKGVLILEMIGYFSDQPGSQQYPSLLLKALYPSTGNFLSVVGGFGDRRLLRTCKKAMKGAAPLKVISSCIPRSLEMVHLSDHRNYWKFDYDAVMITDTSFYRNPHYHQPTDTWETLDYERMAQVVTQVHQAVLALAGKE